MAGNQHFPARIWLSCVSPSSHPGTPSSAGLGRTTRNEGLSLACPGTGEVPLALRAVQHHLCQHTTHNVVFKTQYGCPVTGDYEVSFHAISFRSVLHPQYSTYGGESIAKWGELGGWNRKSRGAS